MTTPELIHVTADNVAKTGFFCKMSGRKQPGYQRKLAWLQQRFDEGLQMRMLGGGERGFVEFIPGKYAWRAIKKAQPYLVIHCLWVVGRSKGKGFGHALLQEVMDYAQANGFKGVAAVVSSGVWLISHDILSSHGFTSVATAPPGFDLMVHKFDPGTPDPAFCGGWEKKARAYGDGLVVFRTDQCPYIDDATKHIADFAKARKLAFTEVELTSAADVRKLSPTAYGVFAIVKDGTLWSYHYLLPKDLKKLAA